MRPGLITAYAYAKAFLPEADKQVHDMLALAYLEGAHAMNTYMIEKFKEIETKEETNGN